MKKNLVIVALSLSAMMHRTVNGEENIATSPSIGNTHTFAGSPASGRIEITERKLLSAGARATVVWFALNANAPDAQLNAMRALDAGTNKFGNGPGAFTAIEDGKLEAWMLSLVGTGGNAYRLHAGLVFEAPTAQVLPSVTSWTMRSSDPVNNLGFSGNLTTNAVFGDNLWGTDTVTSTRYTSGSERRVNRIVFLGAGNGFNASIPEIQGFLEANKPFTNTITYAVDGLIQVKSEIRYAPSVQPPPPPPVTGKFVISPSTVVKPTGEVTPGTPLELVGSVWNPGNASYLGILTNTWEYSANGGPWRELASAGRMTNLVSGESKSVVTYNWNAGPADATVTYRLRLRSSASDGDHNSDETIRVIAPLPPISMHIAKAGGEISIIVSGPAGTYELRRTEDVGLPWDRWSIVTTSSKGTADARLIKFGFTLGMGIFKVGRVK